MDLIELQKAYATQTDGVNGKSEWIVYNEKKEVIHRLPKELTEKHVMKAIRMGREFELKAFNTGISFERGIKDGTINKLNKQIEALAAENTKLSEALQKEIFSE